MQSLKMFCNLLWQLSHSSFLANADYYPLSTLKCLNGMGTNSRNEKRTPVCIGDASYRLREEGLKNLPGHTAPAASKSNGVESGDGVLFFFFSFKK